MNTEQLLREALEWIVRVHEDPTLSHERDFELWGPTAKAALSQPAQPAPAEGGEVVADKYKQAPGSKNCMQCAVAYMLGLPVDAVRDFERESHEGVPAWESMEAFFESHGFSAEMFPPSVEIVGDYLASGVTARGTSHMVVMRGGKLLHDPHPSNDGLASIQAVWIIARRAGRTTPQPKAAEGGEVATGSFAHLKLMMEHSAWDGVLQLSDAIANIDEFSTITTPPASQEQPEHPMACWSVDVHDDDDGRTWINIRNPDDDVACLSVKTMVRRGRRSIAASVLYEFHAAWQAMHCQPAQAAQAALDDVRVAVRVAVLAEREACAKVCAALVRNDAAFDRFVDHMNAKLAARAAEKGGE